MKFCKDCKFFVQENPAAIPTCAHSSATYKCSDWLVSEHKGQWDCESMRRGFGIIDDRCGFRARYFEPRP